MRVRKNNILKLACDAAFIAAIALANRCLIGRQKPMVNRDDNEEQLNRKLTVVSLVYHAIGIFYNE